MCRWQGLVSSAGTFTKGLERIANNNMQPPATNRSAAGAPAQQDEYLMRLLRGTPSGSRCTTSLQQNHTGQVCPRRPPAPPIPSLT